MLAALADRLRDAAPSLRQVDTAAAYAALEVAPPRARCPAAFLVETDTDAGPQGLAVGGHRQVLTERFAAVLFLDAARDARGAAAAEAAREVRQEVLAALLGFTPDQAYEPVVYLGGRLLSAEGGYLVWQDDFATRRVVKV